MRPDEVAVVIERVVLFGKLGGLAGTNFPRTVLSCAMPSVTVVVVVNVTALLVKLPRLGVPMSMVLPNTPAMLPGSLQKRFPAPSVVNK